MMRKVEDKGTYIARIASADNLEKVNRTSKAVKPRKSIYLKYIKRIIDLVITVPVFIVVLPINFIVGVITLFDVGVPVFFKQERTGKDGKHFYLIKFRNMTFAEDDNGNLLPPSERVTKFGTFVRK